MKISEDNFTGNSASVGIGNVSAGTTMYAYNNTVVGSYLGFWVNSGSVVAKHNISYNYTDNYSGTFDGSGTNNLSGPGSDAQMPTANARNGYTVAFVNESGRDLHLASYDNEAQERGSNLSADANLSFATDIDGQSRPNGSAWDIGADECFLASTLLTFNSKYVITSSSADTSSSTRW